jgi:hypothetical protein
MKPLATALLVSWLLPAAGLAADRTPLGAAIAGGGPFEPTLAAIQENVFTPSCALSFCHGSSMSANLDLRDGHAYDSIVNVESVETPPALRIAPYLPDESYLICKLEACSWIVGQQMPLIGGPLEQAVIDVIRDWVAEGAPEFPTISVQAASWGRIKATYR